MPYFSELKGKRVIVVGGSKGIGKDIAVAFSQLGSDVLITGRNEKDLHETTEELRQYNPKCSYLPGDIQHVNEIYEMIDQAHSRLGRIDVLVNNAGVNIAKPALEISEEDWDRVLDTNPKVRFSALNGPVSI